MMQDTIVGPALLLRHAGAVGATLALLLLHAALGERLLRASGVGANRAPGWRWPMRVALGAGVLASVHLALGLVGWLTPRIVLGVAVVSLGVLRRDVIGLLGELRNGVASLRGRDLGVDDLTLLLIVGTGLIALVGALAPTTDWDSLMYHLRVPAQFLEAGRVYLPRDNFHVALVGVAQMSTLPLLAAAVPTGPALMQAAVLVLVLVATAELARSVELGRIAGTVAVAILVGCPMLLLVGITARVDVTLALLLLCAHLSLLGATDASAAARERHALLWLAAALLGFAVGIKPQAGAYAIALVPLGWRAAGGWRPAARAAVLALLVFAPWGIKNQVLVGSVAYPAAAPRWFVPWIADLYGGKDIGPDVDQTVFSALGDARESFNVLDAFLHPGRLTIEGEGTAYRLSPALLLLPLVLIGWSQRRARAVVLVAVAYAALVVVPFGRINLRYLIPALPGMAIGVGLVVERLLAARSARFRRPLLVAVCGVAMLPIVPALRERFVRSTVLLRHAIGVASAADVWRQHPDPTVGPIAPAAHAVSVSVPPDGLVLMLFETRGFAFDRPVLEDVLLSNWSYVSQSPVVDACLAGSGITHVLINTGALGYYASRGTDLKTLRVPELQRFAAQCLGERVYARGGEELWTLRTAPRGP